MINTPPAAWTQQGDPYWTIPGRVPITNEVMGDSTRYYDLLNKKVAEAEANLKAELHSQLWGRKPESNPLRQTIANAYDQVTYETVTSSTLSAYKDRISQQIFSESPILKGLASLRQEKEVTINSSNAIALEAVAKRKEKRAKTRVAFVGDYLEDNEWEDGDTVSWTVNFHTNAAKTYHYVAVRGGYYWYITGDAAKYTPSDLTAKIVALSLDGKLVLDGDPL
jgi:hypothetical protein